MSALTAVTIFFVYCLCLYGFAHAYSESRTRENNYEWGVAPFLIVFVGCLGAFPLLFKLLGAVLAGES